MNRVDLVATMAASSGWTKAATFSVSRRKPRKGKNPRTGQPMNVAGGRTPRFKPSRELKLAVR
jgi:nucleoid DNA-binding protein